MIGGDAGQDRPGPGALVGGAPVRVGRRLRVKQVLRQPGVAAAVPALARPNLDRVAGFEVGVNLDPGALGDQLAGGGAVPAEVDRLLANVLQAALAAHEGDDVALPGRESVQRVTHAHSIAVAHSKMQGVLDVDLRAEDAAIAPVAVVVLVVEVRMDQIGVEAQVDVEWALRGFGAVQAAPAGVLQAVAGGGARGVEVARSGGVDALRHGG